MTNVGLTSYALGAIAHIVLALYLYFKWQNSQGSRQFLLTILVNAAWAALLAYHSWTGRTIQLEWITVAEIIRITLWILLVWRFLFGSDRRSWPRDMAYKVHGTWVAVAIVNVSVISAHLLSFPLVSPVVLYISSLFVLAILGFVLIYQYYRNSMTDHRWQVKFFCLGVGGLFVYDLFVFSLGVLFRGLESDLWNARGMVNMVVAPLLAVSIQRMQAERAELSVSRNFVFYSTGLLVVGFYLIAIAAGGYFIRIVGGSWGTFALIVFFFSAVMALLAVLFSGQARAQLKVFLDKNFFHYRYDYRKEWLNLTQVLSAGESEESLEIRCLRAVSDIVKSPGGALWLKSNERYTVREAWNMDDYAGVIEHGDDSLARFLKNREWIIDKQEYQSDAQLYGDLALPEWFCEDKKAWLVLPLIYNEDLMGFVVLANSMAMSALTWEDRDLLKSVGRQIASQLALQQSARALTETRQFEAYNRLVAFIMHDLKNLIAQQSLMVRNAAKHKDNPEFIDDAIATVDNSVARMNHLLDQLQRGDQGGHRRRANLIKICREVIRHTAQRRPVPVLSTDLDELRVYVDDERFSMVLGHLVRNAQDATGNDGSVILCVDTDGDRAIIEVRDTGSGMEPEFIRDRLFVPFDTTKGAKGMGIGVYQAREFIQAAGGVMEVESTLGDGSVFRLCLPLAEASGETQNGSEIETGKSA